LAQTLFFLLLISPFPLSFLSSSSAHPCLMGNCKRQEEKEQERVGRAACCKERTNSRRCSILFHSLLLLFDPLSSLSF
jgi:hypothetical protein